MSCLFASQVSAQRGRKILSNALFYKIELGAILRRLESSDIFLGDGYINIKMSYIAINWPLSERKLSPNQPDTTLLTM